MNSNLRLWDGIGVLRTVNENDFTYVHIFVPGTFIFESI